MKPIKHIEITKLTKSEHFPSQDQVIVEEPLQIRLHYFDRNQLEKSKNIAITMRTPGEDIALGKGFLFTEDIVESWLDIQKCESFENQLDIYLKQGVKPIMANLERNIYTTSSCGICGKASIEHISRESAFLPWSEKWSIQASSIYALVNQLDEEQGMFSITGGNHAAALFDNFGNFIRIHEDVGRHNAMDKLIGASESLPLSKHIVLWSGRSSFELVQKAAKAGLCMVVSVGAPSSLAIEMAEEHGMTLVGFLKKESMNIYTAPERIVFS